jgi:sterol desaturase/sphingolipid hydroxylase (fatty acid hydroxylase superfamily)
VHHAIAFVSQVLSLTVWLVLLTVVFIPLERFFALRLKVRRPRDIAGDLAYYFMNSLLPTFLLALPLSVVASIAQKLTPSAYTEFVSDLPLWARVLVGIVVGEFGAYWGHRLCHQTPWMWQFHKVHHSPESLDWMVNTRAHPLDVAFTRLCGLVPLYILGLAAPHGEGQLLPVIVTLVGTVWAFFVHANLKWRFGPLEWLVATPAFHHWHHTNDEHRDHNYAALLPVIDRIFGTHYLPAQWPPVYGVDEPIAPGLLSQLMDPLGGPPRTPAAGPSEARSNS